eukprot:8595662-Pyramimonas_sp.AAC.1
MPQQRTRTRTTTTTTTAAAAASSDRGCPVGENGRRARVPGAAGGPRSRVAFAGVIDAAASSWQGRARSYPRSPFTLCP